MSSDTFSSHGQEYLVQCRHLRLPWHLPRHLVFQLLGLHSIKLTGIVVNICKVVSRGLKFWRSIKVTFLK